MTPAIKLLEQAAVPFKLHRYEHAADADSFGMEAAEKLGVPAERVFKTLVVRTDAGSLAMAVLPSSGRLSVKAMADALGARRCELADPAAAERATGYVVGGISPLGGKKRLAVVLDASAANHGTIFISAGRRGLQLELAPADLARVAAARTADLLAQA